MKYIAGSILFLAVAVYRNAGNIVYRNAGNIGDDTIMALMVFLGFALICLGVWEDIVTFMKNRVKRE